METVCFTKTLLVTVTGWYHTKHPMHCGHFIIHRASTSEFQSFPIHPPEFSALIVAETPSSEAERTGREVTTASCLSVSLSYLKGSLTCSKSLRHGVDGFTSLRRELCYGFLSPIKIHRPRPGLSPRTSGPMESDDHFILATMRIWNLKLKMFRVFTCTGLRCAHITHSHKHSGL
jgi:hypothetical protein